MSYDVASFGLIYNHNVARNQWPQEVPSAIRSERYAVVKLTSEISLTVWSLPGDASVERDVPVLCGRAPYSDIEAFYSSWVVFRARGRFAQFLVLDMKEEFALESIVGEACCQALFSACRVCCEHVWQCYSEIEHLLKPVVQKSGANWNHVRKCWTRTYTTASRALDAAKESKLFRAQTLQQFSDMAQQSTYGDVKLQWTKFLSEVPPLPIWELKVMEGPELAKDFKTFLACMRRGLHNNMVYNMLSEAIVAHLCGKAGGPIGGNKGQKRQVQQVWEISPRL